VKIEAPRGTLDVLPAEQPAREAVIRAAESAAADYGYGRITTPTFEDTDLFARTSGAGSDVVQKEMYTFEDRGGRSLTLRPEATAPVARAYLEHGLHREPQPVKTFLIGPMFRYSAPQKGRYREFWQINFEAMGSPDPAVDAELIHLFTEIARRARVRYTRLELNSIGDRECRPAYVDALVQWLQANDEALDDDARQKRATNPLRVFDVKNDKVRAALGSAPTIDQYLCEACQAHFTEVRSYLDAYGIEYALEPTLVRGLDYYTRTVFEFVNEGLDAAQDTICAGGRYDYLIEEIGGPATPGVGWAAGVERMVLSRDAEDDVPGIDVFLALDTDTSPQARARLVGLVGRLRAAGIASEMDYAGRSPKGQRTQAGRLNARYTVIAKGREEAAEVWERGGSHEDVPIDAVEGYLLERLGERP
jgi:histidyl-tRNA synthetase